MNSMTEPFVEISYMWAHVKSEIPFQEWNLQFGELIGCSRVFISFFYLTVTPNMI
jgi:hypothetical protein